jgi:hypothetical protein
LPAAGGGSPGTSASTLRQVLMAAAASPWVSASDTHTGVRFRLPHRPVQTSQNTNGLSERLYTAALNGNVAGVTIGFIDVGSAARATLTLNAYADEMQAQFKAVGAPKDFAITEKVSCTYQGRACQDMRVGFTPLSQPHTFTLWLIRVVADGPEIVLLQTIAEAPKPEQDADLAFVRTIQHRLARSVSLP